VVRARAGADLPGADLDWLDLDGADLEAAERDEPDLGALARLLVELLRVR
jgi:uncharacterized protein YjbI with pentapeptide repeats